MTNGAEDWLQAGCRVIRHVVGGSDSPWPGALVCTSDDATALAVDTAVLGPDWAGWTADPAGHLVAPMEVLRRSDGHDVLVPVCTERLAEFLKRRGSGADVATGEAVTLAVSLLRGAAEVPTELGDAPGTWWLTEAGRPLLAMGSAAPTADGEDGAAARTRDASEGAIEQTARHLRNLCAVPALAAVLEEAAIVVGDPRRRLRETERMEAAIFAIADPVALATTSFGPKRVRTRLSGTVDAATSEIEPAPGPWAFSLARHMDADWADLVSRTTTSVWRALRTRREKSRRPWLLAGGLAVVVLTGGLMWPAGDTGPATAEVPVSPTAPTREGTASMSPDPASPSSTEEATAGAQTPEDLTVIAGELLAARTACVDDACLAAVVENPGGEMPGGVVDLPAEDRVLTLLDEFGGAAVLRAESISGDATPQLVAIVRVDGRWLLRDVYDIPQQ